MSTIDSGFQVTDKGLMELFRRMEPLIRAMLASVKFNADGFIRFNFDNEGGYLDITAPDSDGGGYSLKLTGEANVLLASTDSLLNLEAASYIRSTYADDGDFEFNGVGNGLVATIHGDGTTTITLLDTGAGAVTVKNHLGSAIFRIDENGDLHGKSGKALVFDL